MAPIQVSYDVKISLPDEDFRSPWKKPKDLLLPIKQRGGFFHDAFFSDIRQEFDVAVREILEEWADGDLKLKDLWQETHGFSNVMWRYRQLRSRNLKDGIRALKMKLDDTSHKVLIDVHDFMEGEIKVKVEGETELLVEGSVEKKDEGTSSVSSHAFRRRFSLPRLTDTRDISSAMSSDGVLTIILPQKDQRDKGRTRTIPVEMKETSEDETLRYSFGSLSITRHVSSQTENEELKAADLGFTRSLPILRRGNFFQDSFFSDFHEEFEAAVREVLSRWRDIELKWVENWNNIESQISNKLQHSRHLRSLHLQEKTDHAVNVASNNNRHKIVLDMQDFVDGDVAVKVVGEKDLMVEGRVEKRERGSSMISRSFRRRFALPLLSDTSAVTSVMSSDGILTISAPKKDRESLKDITPVPINLEPSEKNNLSLVRVTNCVDGKSVSLPDSILLPVTRRGLFFRDYFFEDSRDDFRKAVKEILSKWGGESSTVDDVASYRRLRFRDLREDTQAFTSSEDERQHKFVIDVHDFMDDGKISVKAVNDRELVVEGHLKEQKGGSESFRRFLRRFAVPERIKVEAVTSAMSSDGVLKILAPKKEVPQRTIMIPVELKDQNQSPVPMPNNVDQITSSEPSVNVLEEDRREKDLLGPPPSDDDDDDDDDDDEGYTLIIMQPEQSLLDGSN